MFTDAELITVCQLCSHPPTAHVAMTINNSKGVCTLCNSLEQEKKVPQYQPQSVDYAGPADEAKMSVAVPSCERKKNTRKPHISLSIKFVIVNCITVVLTLGLVSLKKILPFEKSNHHFCNRSACTSHQNIKDDQH
jgi:hypothetical protein